MIKKRIITILPGLLCAAIMLLIGFFVRKSVYEKQKKVIHLTAKENRFESSKSLNLRKKDDFRGRQSRLERELYFIALLEKAELEDLPKLVEAMSKEKFHGAFRIAIGKWIEKDMKHFLQSFISLSRNEGFKNYSSQDRGLIENLSHFYKKWPQKYIKDVYEVLFEMQKGDDFRNSFVVDLFRLLYSEDLPRALEVLSYLEVEHYYIQPRVLEKWMARDPRKTTELLLKHLEPIHRMHKRYSSNSQVLQDLGLIAEVWVTQSPQIAMNFSVGRNGALIERFQKAGFEKWLSYDDQAAVTWFGELKSIELQDRLRPIMIESWASDSPYEAFDWCLKHLNGQRLIDSSLSIIEEVSKSDVDVSISLLSEFPVVAYRRAAKLAVRQWFKNKDRGVISVSAIDWLREVKNQKLKSELISSVQHSWVYNNKEEVKAFFEEPVNRGLSPNVYNVLMEKLMKDDAQSAIDWPMQFGPEIGAHVSNYGFQFWIRNRPSEAIEWAKRLPLEDPRWQRLHWRLADHFKESPQNTVLLKGLSPEIRERVEREMGK